MSTITNNFYVSNFKMFGIKLRMAYKFLKAEKALLIIDHEIQSIRIERKDVKVLTQSISDSISVEMATEKKIKKHLGFSFADN